MNKFVLAPTDENLERLKKVQDGKFYWHTADFFQFDPTLEDKLSDIFDVYMDALMESQEENEEKAIHKIGFSIGRILVKEARKAGISPQDYRDQLDNYATVVWTPICIRQKDKSGEISYSLMSNLPSDE